MPYSTPFSRQLHEHPPLCPQFSVREFRGTPDAVGCYWLGESKNSGRGGVVSSGRTPLWTRVFAVRHTESTESWSRRPAFESREPLQTDSERRFSHPGRNLEVATVRTLATRLGSPLQTRGPRRCSAVRTRWGTHPHPTSSAVLGQGGGWGVDADAVASAVTNPRITAVDLPHPQ